MAGLHLVAIHLLALEISINLMEVQTMVACDERLHELDVLAHLVNVAGTARIVASGLDTAREGIVTFETHYIVGLPAVQ